MFWLLGNEYYCWITNPIALAVFFAVPVVLMLLFNIVALVRVLVAVRRVRKVSLTLSCFNILQLTYSDCLECAMLDNHPIKIYAAGWLKLLFACFVYLTWQVLKWNKYYALKWQLMGISIFDIFCRLQKELQMRNRLARMLKCVGN